MSTPSKSEHHDLDVYYVTKADEMEELIKKHILDEDRKVVGLVFKSKKIDKRTNERKRKVVVIQLSTDTVSMIFQIGSMDGFLEKATEGNLAEIMQNVDIKKVGLNVLQLVGMLKNDYGLECKGVYDLIPMAQRIKNAAAFKGNTKYEFPDLEASQQINKGIWKLCEMALEKPYKTPHEVHAANWSDTIDSSVVSWLSYEPIVSRQVYTFLTDVETEITAAKGPTRIHVTNLPGDVTPEEIKEHFKCTYNKLPTIHTAPKNRSTANAAIFFNEQEEAEAALKEFRGTDYKGREVLIAESEDDLKNVEQDMQKRRVDYQVYMSNLPYFTTEAQLRHHFRNLADDIREAKFYCHQDLGVGSVYFKTKESAARAVREYNNSKFWFAVNKFDPETKEIKVERKVRYVMLDTDFLTVIKKQKKNDRAKGKGDQHYDALDPYYSHQQRLKGKKADEEEELHNEGEKKARMRKDLGEKTKMRVVRDDGTETTKMPTDEAEKGNAVPWLIQMNGELGEGKEPPSPPPPQSMTPPSAPAPVPSGLPAATTMTSIEAEVHHQPAAQAHQPVPSSVPVQSAYAAGMTPASGESQKMQQHIAQQAMLSQIYLQNSQMQMMQYLKQQAAANPQSAQGYEAARRLQQQALQLQQAQVQQKLQMQLQQQQAQKKQMEQQKYKQQQQQMHHHHQQHQDKPADHKVHVAQSPMGVPGYISVGGTPVAGFYNGPGASSSSSQYPAQGVSAVAGAAPAAVGNTGIPSTNAVHVIGIPFPCAETELVDYFKQVGPVVSCSIQQSKGGANAGNGHATIAFTTPQYAQLAVEKLNHMQFKGRMLTVAMYKQRSVWTPAQPLTSDSFPPNTEKIKVEKPKEGIKVTLEPPPGRKKEAEEAKEE